MRVRGVYSGSHEALFRDWFAGTLADDFDVEFRRTEQLCESAYFMNVGWVRAVSAKVDFLVETIRGLPEGEAFVFSDVDVQWFGPAAGLLAEADAAGADMLFQEDAGGEFCTGFFLCRAGERTERFWRAVLGLMRRHTIGDQKGARLALERGLVPGVRVGHLPRSFWGPGPTREGTEGWVPGEPLDPPADIVMHHANWTFGVGNKARQLEYVRSIVEGRRGAA